MRVSDELGEREAERRADGRRVSVMTTSRSGAENMRKEIPMETRKNRVLAILTTLLFDFSSLNKKKNRSPMIRIR